MKILNASPQVPTSVTLPTLPQPPSQPPDPPKESFVHSGGREAVRNAVRWGNATSTVLGGAGALTLATGSLYAGVLGGAVVGSALGLGAGPVVASLGSSGALSFLGTTFTTAGLAAKTGIVLGGAAMAAGAWGIGGSLGSAIGKPVGALLGAPVGFAQGVWGHMEGATPAAPAPAPASAPKPPVLDLNNMSGATKMMAMGIGGMGLLAGGAGGAILGASVASTHNLVQGLLAHNVTLAAITGAAGIGALIGAGAGAVIGGKGGFELAKGVQKAGAWVGEKLIRSDSRPEAPRSDVKDKAQKATSGLMAFSQQVSAAQLGLNLADLGMGVAYPASSNPAVGPLGFGMAALHGARAVVHLFGSMDTSGLTLQHRLSTAAGDALIAGGHILGANGAGGWSLPLLGAGVLLNTVSDYRNAARYGV
ncbi:hypothetical protein JST97_36640 [bacterium]|nr:hypothetical protein [bacterium]